MAFAGECLRHDTDLKVSTCLPYVRSLGHQRPCPFGRVTSSGPPDGPRGGHPRGNGGWVADARDRWRASALAANVWPCCFPNTTNNNSTRFVAESGLLVHLDPPRSAEGSGTQVDAAFARFTRRAASDDSEPQGGAGQVICSTRHPSVAIEFSKAGRGWRPER